MDQEIQELTDNIATSTLKIFKTEKANKFFRIGFFILLVLFSASVALTIYTRFVPAKENPLAETVANQQLLIDQLTTLSEEQKVNIKQLEGNSIAQQQSIDRSTQIINNSAEQIAMAKTANEKAQIAMKTVMLLYEELRGGSK